MPYATITIEHEGGSTEVWNATQEQADTARTHLVSTVGAPDLDTQT
jgi:hypothetical protein